MEGAEAAEAEAAEAAEALARNGSEVGREVVVGRALSTSPAAGAPRNVEGKRAGHWPPLSASACQESLRVTIDFSYHSW